MQHTKETTEHQVCAINHVVSRQHTHFFWRQHRIAPSTHICKIKLVFVAEGFDNKLHNSLIIRLYYSLGSYLVDILYLSEAF